MCLIFVLFVMGAVLRDQDTASMTMGLNEVTRRRVCNREEVGPKTIQCSLSAVGLGTAHSDISAFKDSIFFCWFSPSAMALLKEFIICYAFLVSSCIP